MQNCIRDVKAQVSIAVINVKDDGCHLIQMNYLNKSILEEQSSVMNDLLYYYIKPEQASFHRFFFTQHIPV